MAAPDLLLEAMYPMHDSSGLSSGECGADG